MGTTPKASSDSKAKIEAAEIAKTMLEDATLKEKHPDIYAIIRSEGKKLCVLKPNRYVLSPVMAQINIDPVKALEELALAITIEEISDMELINDDDLFIGIMPALSGMVKVKKSTLTIV